MKMLAEEDEEQSSLYDKTGKVNKKKLHEMIYGRDGNHMSALIKDCNKNPLTISGTPVY